MLHQGCHVHEPVAVVINLVNPALGDDLARFVSCTPAAFAHVS